MINDEDKIWLEIFKELGIENVTPEIYKDLLQPAVKELGRNLLDVAKVVSIALSPLKGAIWGYEHIRDWLSVKLTEKLSHISTEKIQSPCMNIAGPILLQLPFYKDEEELRDMYATLLASAMNRDLSPSVHPSFVTIIQQLTPDEAHILKWIAENKNKGSIAFEQLDSRGFSTGKIYWIEQQFNELCESVGVRYPEQSSAYLDNLLRLKILSENSWDDVKYIPEGGNEYGTYEASVQRETSKEIYITEFGKQFLSACVTNTENKA
jgi:hypothetical protein